MANDFLNQQRTSTESEREKRKIEIGIGKKVHIIRIAYETGEQPYGDTENDKKRRTGRSKLEEQEKKEDDNI